MSNADSDGGPSAPPLHLVYSKFEDIRDELRGEYEDDELGRHEWVEEHGGVMEGIDTLVQTTEELADELQQQRERNDRLEDRLTTLEQRIDDDGQRGKVAKIVEMARNKHEGQTGVVMTASDIKAATGVSRRYAYDLIERLPQKYDFLLDNDEVTRYGELEMDRADLPKGLVVVFDAVHTDLESVNKFTTRSGQKGGDT